jgi:hypothetical protein
VLSEVSDYRARCSCALFLIDFVAMSAKGVNLVEEFTQLG